MFTKADRHELLALARRRVKGRMEAEDLVQDALLASLLAGRGAGTADRAWMGGVMRNLSRMEARSAARRSRRDALSIVAAPSAVEPQLQAGVIRIDGLPKALRVVAALALSGQTRAEIRYLLGISDEALRQRISAIRRHFRSRGEPMPAGLPGLRGGLAYGSIRKGLIPMVRRLEAGIATHDPDGHPIIFGKIALPAHKIRGGGNRQM